MNDPERSPPAPSPVPWIGLFLLALLLFSFPWLAPPLQRASLGGMPGVLLYVFLVWGGLIAASALLSTRGARR